MPKAITSLSSSTRIVLQEKYLLSEIRERVEMEKNIGITESKTKDLNEQQACDKRVVKKQLGCVTENEMQPLKIRRLGEYKTYKGLSGRKRLWYHVIFVTLKGSDVTNSTYSTTKTYDSAIYPKYVKLRIWYVYSTIATL